MKAGRGVVGRDWLQLLCLVNRPIEDCTKHARKIYFILFYFKFILFQRVPTREIK